MEKIIEGSIGLLMDLIRTQSFSKEEDQTAEIINTYLKNHGVETNRELNNVWAFNKFFDSTKPTLLLNSHHDTVKPNTAYTNDPFDAFIKDGKLHGLGSNDAGGALVALLATFTYFYNNDKLSHNLVMVASAEEESSGKNGLNSVLKHLPTLELAIVGEPTQMELAIAEKGLLVLDVNIKGTASHAAHINPDNSIYNALKTIEWFRDYKFDKISEVLGPVKMTVTQINAGKQHNVVPADTNLVVDVRVNDKYSNQEVYDVIKQQVITNQVDVKARSLNLNSSSIAKNHPLVQAGIKLGRSTYGSPTLSDQSVLYCQSLKMGPGDSPRSHTANEYIYIHEIEEGVQLYITMLSDFLLQN